MRKNKFSKWIERILVCLPLFYVAISSAYVIFNKNAKDSFTSSYSETTLLSNEGVLENGALYSLNTDKNISISNSQRSYAYGFDSISLDLSEYFSSPNEVKYIGFFYTSSNYRLVGYYDNPIYTNTQNSSSISYDDLISFSFVSNGLVYSDTSFTNHFDLYIHTLTPFTLNNVMTYSMSEFNKFGFGKLDFTSWFTNIFMNGDTNNVYVSFVNSYINYFLLVECVYFIPMIIYWFIHFGESVVEKFMNKE